MFFTIENNLANWEFTAADIFANAKLKILNYKLTPADKLLDNYLKTFHHVNLIEACIYLLSDCKIYRDKDNTLIVKFNTTKADKLAALITYGNRQVRGSKILSNAFGRTLKNSQADKRKEVVVDGS